MTEGFTIIIPTFNGGEIFQKCLAAIQRQRSNHTIQLIVIDSGSTDGTLEAARQADARIIQINKEDFHHSRTRNRALQYAAHDRVVFLVQDAIPSSPDWLEIMSNALESDNVAAVYGQHLPHDEADLFAWFETTAHREMLGERTLIQEVDSRESFLRMPYERALRLIRCDNVCALYRRDILTRFPFPDVVFGEDMAWAKTALLNGLKIKYEPAIRVKHSHNRPPEYRFRRVLISNIVLASILERVREDLSFLSCRDLEQADKILVGKLGEVSSRLDGREGKRRLQFAPFWSLLLRIPYFNGAVAVLGRRLSWIGRRRRWALGFSRIVDVHIDLVLEKVTRAFPAATNQELLSCVEQLLALIKGNLYGGVAASCQLQGKPSPELDRIIKPYLGGI